MTTPRLEAIKVAVDAMTAVYAVAPDFVAEMLSALIEECRVGSPVAVFTTIADDAEWWAANATPVEMEAYLTAIARHLPDTHTHAKARKRIVAAMFKAMSTDDRAAFMTWAGQQ